jgi:hypothetical protein
MKCTKCGTELMPEDKFCSGCGAPRPQVPPRFAEIERRFNSLRARYQAGELGDAAYDAELQRLVIEDDAGGHWMLGTDSGKWYRHDGQQWVRRDPPPAGTAVELPPAWPTSPQAAAPAPAPPLSERLPWKWIALGCGGLLIVTLILVALAVAVAPQMFPSITTMVQPLDMDATATQVAADIFATQAAASTAMPTEAPTIVPTPTLTPSPEPTPLLPGGIPGETIENPESGLVIRSHAVVRDEDGNMLAFGEVENVSDGEIETSNYEVYFTPYDAAGQVIQTEYPMATFLLPPVLAPDQKALFFISMVRDWGFEDITDRAERYTVEIRNTEGGHLVVELGTQDLSWNPGGELTGVVVNSTESTIDRMGIFVLLASYNADGRLIDVAPADAMGWFLAPGESRPFRSFGNIPGEAAAVDAVAIGNPAEDLIFYDDFSDPDSGWRTYADERGAVQYEEEALVLVAKGPDGDSGVVIPDIQAQDFHLSFTATPMSDPGDWRFGVTVRFVPANLGYFFELTGDGQYSISGVAEQSYESFVDLTPSEEIKTSGFNLIGIFASGETLSFYVNGEKLAEITDARALEGKIEFWTYVETEQEIKVAIDDLVVRQWP